MWTPCLTGVGASFLRSASVGHPEPRRELAMHPVIRAVATAASMCLIIGCADRIAPADTHADDPRVEWVGGPVALPEERILARVREVIAERGYPGLAAAVRVGDAGGWRVALGFADLEALLPITADSRFAIGSISKAITATAVVRLAGRGAVSLDQDVRSIVPRAAGLNHPVSLRQLLSHQAGIRHYRIRPWYSGFSEFYSNVQASSSDAALAVFVDDGLRFEPDTDFLYSTFGFTLAAAAVEVSAGQSFWDIVSQEVGQPLALASLAVDVAGAPARGRTRDYRRLRGGHLAAARPTNSSTRIAGAGFVASADDLARFGLGILDTSFLSRDLREQLLTPRRLRSGEENPQRYALGWRAGRLRHPTDSTRGIDIVHHGGSAPGAESVLIVVPERRISVAMAANARTGGSDALLSAAADIARLLVFTP